MTAIILIALASIAIILARTIVNHPLVLAVVLVGSSATLFGAPAVAVPAEDDASHQEQRDDPSIRLEAAQPLEPFYDASETLDDELSPVRRNSDALPLELREDGRALDLRKRIADS